MLSYITKLCVIYKLVKGQRMAIIFGEHVSLCEFDLWSLL